MVGKVINSLLKESLVRKQVKEVYADGDLLHIIAEDEEEGLVYNIYFNLYNPTGGVNVVITEGHEGKVVSMWHYRDSMIYYLGPK